MHLFILSAENLDLAEYEALSVLRPKSHKRLGNMLIADVPKRNMSRMQSLAFVHRAYELLFESIEGMLTKNLEQYRFLKIYSENFCVRIHGISDVKLAELERLYAGFIWRNLKASGIEPKVDLECSGTLIEFFYHKKMFYVCKFLFENNEDFVSRRAHLRPELHPTAMHPKLARALVNILNPSGKNMVIDPMCGSGGILIEAGLMGMRFKGYDIDQIMLNRARINFDHYKISRKAYALELKDSLNAGSLMNIITDLPYGKSSKASEELISLYSKFSSKIKGRAIVVFPDDKKYYDVIRKNLGPEVRIIQEFRIYIHKSLTRTIILVDKKR